MKYVLAIVMMAQFTVHAYERQCLNDVPNAPRAIPFGGGEYSYYLQLRQDDQTLTPGNIQEAATKTCYVRLSPADKQELQGVLAAYPVDKQLRDISHLDPLSLVAKVINDVTAKWAFAQGGALPTVQSILELTKPDTLTDKGVALAAPGV